MLGGDRELDLSLVGTVTAIRDGSLSARSYAEAMLEQIKQADGEIGAFAYVNPGKVLEDASHQDDIRRSGRGVGPLNGIPVAIKDIIDTAHMPTEFGCKRFKGRVPYDDAWIVDRLRHMGAIVLGKTETAELANTGPARTRNPHNLDHTPGGSSSGSAAAVASFMAPVAIGTQTGGSVIRPAAYCGVYGFKPTHGMIPRTGVLMQSETLDHVGTFARSIEDLALFSQCLFGHGAGDKATSVLNYPQPLAEIARQDPPLPPSLGFVRTPKWDLATDDCKAAFEELADVLGDRVTEFELTPTFAQGWEWHEAIMDADNAFHYGGIYDDGTDDLHPGLCVAIERGRKITATQYLKAHEGRERLLSIWDEMMEDYDAVITPAATGEAPAGLESTGDPVFCKLWSLLGVPAVSLPLMVGENGLPIGVQLVGRFGEDAKLLRTANWLVKQLAEE